MSSVNMIYQSSFRIRSLKDAEYFLTNVIKHSIDIQDIDDPSVYHSFQVNNGKVYLGTAHYGSNPFTSEIPMCDDKDIIARTYKIRKSINRIL